ncbi:hypothetical protein ONJ87_26480, partial [Salmonella enterica subsp. enterica serovar Anatum]|nr:hypothetical protein [Salmonella enterica subsp. enterica serovar Anatum]
LGSEKFSVTNWNEYEFDRDASYAAGNGGKDGINGAVALWWNALKKQQRITPHIISQIMEFAQTRKGVMIFAATVEHAKEIVGLLP